jgi:hypothetical protein
MGHQVSFFATPTDVSLLEEALQQVGDFLILHSRSATATPRIVEHLNMEESGARWLFLFLVRREDLGHVVMQQVPMQGDWAVDVLCSPVIEFTCSFFDGSILRQGRAFYVEASHDEQGRWVEKSLEFRMWAKGMVAQIKRALPRAGKQHIGDDAAAWLKSSRGRLVQ